LDAAVLKDIDGQILRKTNQRRSKKKLGQVMYNHEIDSLLKKDYASYLSDGSHEFTWILCTGFRYFMLILWCEQ